MVSLKIIRKLQLEIHSMPLNKKDVELHYFQRFKALLNLFPGGSITPTEEPDFLVIGASRIIGIELTELHREVLPDRNPPQATESMRHRVVTRAQEMYVEFGLPPVLCKIFMHDSHIQKNEVEPLAKAIVGIAQRNFPSPNSSTEETYEWVNRHYFPEIINSISMYHLDTMTQANFICSGATWLPKLTSADIERVLSSKDKKYTAYRKRCDEAWLLINVDIGLMSTWFDFRAEAVVGSFETSFDRVFIMRHFGQTLFELPVDKANIGKPLSQLVLK